LVAFQFKELQDCYTPADLKKQLNHLPKDLDAMYDQMLSKITKKNHLHAHKILQWLAFSAHPLGLAEIAEVVAVDLQSLHFDPDHRLHPQFVLDMCAGLVTTNSKGPISV
jgi:ribosomal protein RSM22 (predicted rRNA methylase)